MSMTRVRNWGIAVLAAGLPLGVVVAPGAQAAEPAGGTTVTRTVDLNAAVTNTTIRGRIDGLAGDYHQVGILVEAFEGESRYLRGGIQNYRCRLGARPTDPGGCRLLTTATYEGLDPSIVWNRDLTYAKIDADITVTDSQTGAVTGSTVAATLTGAGPLDRRVEDEGELPGEPGTYFRQVERRRDVSVAGRIAGLRVGRDTSGSYLFETTTTYWRPAAG